MTFGAQTAASAIAPANKSPSVVMQRHCTCGTRTVAGAPCNSCTTPTELTRGAPRRNFELEADEFAEAVSSGKVAAPLSLGASTIGEVSNPLMRAATVAGIESNSEPLPASAKEKLRASVPHGLENIRVHRDPLAHAMTRLVGARAYAVGSDVVLGGAVSDIDSPSSMRVFAHEIAHVGQQTAFRPGMSAGHPQFSMQSYVRAMNEKPEPDWKTAAEHLNGESIESIRKVLANLSPQYRAKLHEAARVWPGLCSNVGRLTEADYLKEHPDTGRTVGNGCSEKTAVAPAGPQNLAVDKSAGAPTVAQSRELNEEDVRTCSPLYLQKLCVHVVGGFNGDRSGVETPEQMSGYNRECRKESAYTGPDVELSNAERIDLRSPRCKRSSPEAAHDRLIAARVADILARAEKHYGSGWSAEFSATIRDPIFIGGLVVALTAYAALWLAPEPIVTKIAAIATTIAVLSTGLFTISTIKNVAGAWMDLQSDAENADTEEKREAAAQRYGMRMGAVECDLVLFLGSLLLGRVLPMPKRLPPPQAAFAQGEAAMSGAKPGGVVIEGPWGKATAIPEPGSGGGTTTTRGALALKVQPSTVPEIKPTELPQPGKVIPLPVPKPAPVVPTAKSPSTGAGAGPAVLPPAVPGIGTSTNQKQGPRPPFVLRLPQQKAPHLTTYRQWLGVLQSDPNYDRGSPAQLEKWHMALRIGGSLGIRPEVYERGHSLGLTGSEGERRIRVPDWSRLGASISMEVDHIATISIPNTTTSFSIDRRMARAETCSGQILPRNAPYRLVGIQPQQTEFSGLTKWNLTEDLLARDGWLANCSVVNN